jgi:acetyl esterase
MKAMIRLLLCLLTAPLFAAPDYPPTFKNARIETYRKVGSTELQLWIFGESDPKVPKPAIVFFFGGGWNSGSPAQFEDQARHFAKRGMIAITADYRVRNRHGVQVVECVKDAKAAIAWVRENAGRLGIDPNKIAASGGSAGGHLVSTLINRPEDGIIDGRDYNISPRPDLAILCYPVISMITKPHATSRKMLIGDSPAEKLLRQTSSELQVKPGLPPVFLWHTMEDKMVPVEHTQLYAAALHQNNIPHELHLYQHGDHGTGLIGTKHPWFADLLFWLKGRGFVK